MVLSRQHISPCVLFMALRTQFWAIRGPDDTTVSGNTLTVATVERGQSKARFNTKKRPELTATASSLCRASTLSLRISSRSISSPPPSLEAGDRTADEVVGLGCDADDDVPHGGDA